MKRNIGRKGMVLLIVVGCVFFAMLVIFATADRVRRESALTARTSLNERLYQLASALGRISARKLQKEFEGYTSDLSSAVKKAILNGQTGIVTGDEYNYTSTIERLDVVKDLKTKFEDEWGAKFEVEVQCTADLGDPRDFHEEMPGLPPVEFERRGHFELEVKVGFKDYKKTCRIRKDFLFVRLLPPPFYRFSLFATKGAELSRTDVNRLEFVKEDGTVDDANPPLIVFNRLIGDLNTKSSGTVQQGGTTVDPDDRKIIYNGWIYLGGLGSHTDLNKEQGLILNICAGTKGDFSQAHFGEFFHLYYDNQSKGWLGSKNWNSRLASIPIPANDLLITFVDYGHYMGLKDLQFPPGQINAHYLFAPTIKAIEDNSSEILSKGSALHLFGTPGLCTPTLIFGNVKRRLVRAFAFYFPSDRKVYPLPFISKSSWDQFLNSVGGWLAGGSGTFANVADFLSTVPNAIPYDYYKGKKTEGLNALWPVFIDYEPYSLGLKNILRPTEPQLGWGQAVQPTLNQFQDLDKPEKLNDYSFRDNTLMGGYTGMLRDILPGSAYLKQKASYLISQETPDELISLKDCAFFNHKFVTKDNSGVNKLVLNQIVAFDKGVKLDIPNLEVEIGGAIIANGRILVTEPVVKSSRKQFLTLISNECIELDTSNWPGITSSGKHKFRQFYGFLVCINGNDGQIKLTYPNNKNPPHIIGGVAVDRIDELVRSGGIIEWGFEPKDLYSPPSTITEFKDPDFYGLSMGPKDMEIVIEE